MKTKIVLVYPVKEDYIEEGLDEHFQVLLSKCLGKNIGLVFVDTPACEIKNLSINKNSDSEEYGLISNSFDYVADYVDYWDTLQHKVNSESKKTIDLSPFVFKAHEFEGRSNASRNLFKKNLFRAQAEFLRMFGDASLVLEEVHKKNIEILVTDFYTGFYLYKTFKKEFSIDYELIDMHDSTLRRDFIDEIQKRLSENELLMQMDINSRPDIVGTWDVHVRDRGKFTLYFLPDAKSEYVSGIISDKYGLASFFGKLDNDLFVFKKSYFYETLSRDLFNEHKLALESVHYELKISEREGQWWIPGFTKQVPCEFRLRIKLSE